MPCPLPAVMPAEPSNTIKAGAALNACMPAWRPTAGSGLHFSLKKALRAHLPYSRASTDFARLLRTNITCRKSPITVRLKKGAVHQAKVDYCKGLPQNPMTREEFEQKFRGLASVVADKNQVDEIINVVGRLDQQKDTSALISLMSQ